MASAGIWVLPTEGFVHLDPGSPGGTFVTHGLGLEDMAFDNQQYCVSGPECGASTHETLSNVRC